MTESELIDHASSHFHCQPSCQSEREIGGAVLEVAL